MVSRKVLLSALTAISVFLLITISVGTMFFVNAWWLRASWNYIFAPVMGVSAMDGWQAIIFSGLLTFIMAIFALNWAGETWSKENS
jgi:hypothetical protein